MSSTSGCQKFLTSAPKCPSFSSARKKTFEPIPMYSNICRWPRRNQWQQKKATRWQHSSRPMLILSVRHGLAKVFGKYSKPQHLLPFENTSHGHLEQNVASCDNIGVFILYLNCCMFFITVIFTFCCYITVMLTCLMGQSCSQHVVLKGIIQRSFRSDGIRFFSGQTFYIWYSNTFTFAIVSLKKVLMCQILNNCWTQQQITAKSLKILNVFTKLH